MTKVTVTSIERVLTRLEEPIEIPESFLQEFRHDMLESLNAMMAKHMGADYQPKPFVFRPKGDVIDLEFKEK